MIQSDKSACQPISVYTLHRHSRPFKTWPEWLLKCLLAFRIMQERCASLCRSFNAKHIRIPSQNCGSLAGLNIYAETLKRPIPKEHFKLVGQKQHLKVVNDIIINPFGRQLNGVCVGAGLLFYAYYFRHLKNLNLSWADCLHITAKQFEKGTPADSALLQALYESLLATSLPIAHKSIQYYRILFEQLKGCSKERAEAIWQAHILQDHANWSNEEKTLLPIIHGYFQESRSCTLRDYVFDMLEDSISAKMYALVLDVEKEIEAQRCLINTEEDHLFQAKQAIAELIGLSLTVVESKQDHLTDAIQKLNHGNYLISVNNHVFNVIVATDGIRVFNLNKGLSTKNWEAAMEASAGMSRDFTIIAVKG